MDSEDVLTEDCAISRIRLKEPTLGISWTFSGVDRRCSFGDVDRRKCDVIQMHDERESPGSDMALPNRLNRASIANSTCKGM